MKRILIMFMIIGLLVGCSKKEEKNLLDPADVLDEVEKAKMETAATGAYNLKRNVDFYYTMALLDGDDFETTIFNCSSDGCISDKGTLDLSIIPSSGQIILNSDGSATYSNIVINGYKCNIPDSGNITCSK